MNIDSKKIIVIDDDEALLEVLSQLLALLGYKVICATNGYDGLSLFLKEKCDIVLTDFDMPGMDGITLAYHIKEDFPETLVVLMTGHDRASMTEMIENSNVDLTLFKPFELPEIMHVLDHTGTQQDEKLKSTCH